jgi:SAM-dependent methyltransferase
VNYWDTKFGTRGSVWGHEPSDSALSALELFRKNGCNKLLIPGFGYGRNAALFIDNGFDVTGIEISEAAIEVARSNEIKCTIHHGTVTSMPFDKILYDAVFCYALVHLLNRPERKKFLRSCFNQVRNGGLMIFAVTSKEMELFGKGKQISNDRFEIEPGLTVFFYDPDSIKKEFAPVGLIEYNIKAEPVKFMSGADPVWLYYVVCKK